MCLYPKPGAASACGQVKSIELSAEEKKEIIQVHNDFRAKVASGKETRGAGGGQPAGDIPPLTWDDSLAEVAQRWASQCKINHDKCRNTEAAGVGQNFAALKFPSGYGSTMTDLMNMLYDEVDEFDPKNINNYKMDFNTGHYTQLVWGATTHVGCGIAKYFDGQWYTTYLSQLIVGILIKLDLKNKIKMIKFLSMLIVTEIIIVHVSATDWCNLQSCDKNSSTMCLYSSDQPGSACKQMDSNELSDDEQQEIIQNHNDFRAKVASGDETRGVGGGQPAGIIPPIYWDDDLAKVAQRWANQCTFGHDKCRDTDTFQAGQNLVRVSNSNGYKSSMTDLVTMWYNEVVHFNPQDVTHFVFSKTTGHYSQLVWGTTTNIGCGVAKYFDGKWYNTYLVCNYGPPGNWVGEQVYQII
ncbi:venom allergen 5-like [Aphidius gifuensis]|uniref:venom allergen 5-like n=1 Tax=Aphidius gifuensis TaxID=684658 RepID=UPI001CDCD269|nr:venom allergen 5-like [Aphidius gifuensis]